MQILLFILKIIGIILLVLLGLVILALTLILFVPIRYEISGEIKDEYQIEANGSIRYLLSIFKAVFSYHDGQMEANIYLFGRRKPISGALSEDDTLDEDDVFEKETFANEEIINEEIKEDEVIFRTKNHQITNNATEIMAENDAIEEANRQSKLNDTQAKQIVNKQTKSRNTGKKVKAKQEKPQIDFERIKKELTDAHNHSVLKKFLRELKYLFSHFGFRKIKTDLHFGAGDPALTGQILGILAMFPILYRYEFGIVPDFETESAYIKGTFSVAGRVRLIHILITGCRLIFDKEVRFVIKKFMDMINQ